MISTGNRDHDEKIKEFYDAGQEHVFRFWEELTDERKGLLIQDVMEVDFSLMKKLLDQHLDQEKEEEEEDVSVEPCSIIDREDDEERDKAEKIGHECLKQGKVAVFLVAGGQGTRLGFDGPKGAFPVGPVTERTLFQIHAEKIIAGSKRYGVTIPWYIMTSKVNNDDTIAFFEENGYFGLNKKDVMFFTQSMVPAVDSEGKFFLEEKDSIFKSPNGHGGSIEALYKNGAVDDMKKKGIEYISYFQVDNPLVRVLDPVFIGFHVMKNAEMSSKVVDKRDAEEKVGVIGYCNGKLGVIEYSDFPDEKKHEKNPDGSLKYSAGSIAIHILSRVFVEQENEGGFSLPFHKAVKKVPYINEKGDRVEPDGKNGVKFETFVFDALGDTKTSVTLRTRREDEFAPVKNKSGEDSPETSKQAMSDMYTRWLKLAGFGGDFDNIVEFSPLVADTPEEVERVLKDFSADTLEEVKNGLKGFYYA